MAIDINAIKKAAEKGASIPAISNLLAKFGVGKEDADQAAKNIVGGQEVEKIVAPLPVKQPFMTPMMIALFGIAIAGVFLFTGKGKGKGKRKRKK